MNFLSNGKHFASNRVVGQLFVCLSAVGLVVRSLNSFFSLRGVFFIIAFSV